MTPFPIMEPEHISGVCTYVLARKWSPGPMAIISQVRNRESGAGEGAAGWGRSTCTIYCTYLWIETRTQSGDRAVTGTLIGNHHPHRHPHHRAAHHHHPSEDDVVLSRGPGIRAGADAYLIITGRDNLDFPLDSLSFDKRPCQRSYREYLHPRDRAGTAARTARGASNSCSSSTTGPPRTRNSSLPRSRP